jgi:hypothetical protein
MPQPGDKIVFLKAFEYCTIGDKGVITKAEADNIAGRFFQRLTIQTDKGTVNLPHSRTARAPIIAILPLKE